MNECQLSKTKNSPSSYMQKYKTGNMKCNDGGNNIEINYTICTEEVLARLKLLHLFLS